MLLVSFAKVVLIASVLEAHGDSNGKGFKFLGSEFWPSNFMEHCSNQRNDNSHSADLSCYSYHINLERVNVEIMSRKPLLLVYRHFAGESERNQFIDDINQNSLEYQNVVDDSKGRILSSSRQANGTWFTHEQTEGSAKLYRKAVRLIPSINFESSEFWQALSYNSGGHYAPHYDFLEYEREEDHDFWMKHYGNRFATFLLILKTAEVGGGTTFPLISTTVKPYPGDAILWMNMTPEGRGDTTSLHGACPIIEGNKIAATLWIRERGQEMRTKQVNPIKHDIEPFIRPFHL
ncbi:unnamed protein product [Auanema sp. JU1783]|nr:unnamed protein product [Auanema sp. JU1783]